MNVSSRLGAWLIAPLLVVSIAAFAAEFKSDAIRPDANRPDLNRAPLANAGLSRTVVVGEVVSLDAGGSTDQDGDRLKFHWVLRTPPGSGARFNNDTSLRPQFTVDLLGKYTAELVVNDGKTDSVADAVTISTGNVAPVAIIDTDLKIGLGEAIVLDGNGSWDFNGDPLDYHWSLVESPSDSRAALHASRSASPNFVADTAGDYLVELSVSDGRYRSKAAQAWLSTINARPHTDAGADRSTYTGTRLRLNADASFDAELEPLAYRWSLLHAPQSSRAGLNATDSATPVLSVDVPGLYLVQVIANDGVQASKPDTMVVTTHKRPAAVSAATRGGTDVDGDGINDDVDNCAEHFNPSQLDSNGDGFGNRCDADLDNDGFITNFGDFTIWAEAWLSNPASANWNPDADFNGDNVVNFGDLFIFQAFFLSAPGPIVNRFINPTGGSWHDPANWSLGVVPFAPHTARIDIGAGVSVDYSTGSSEIYGLRSTTEMLFTGGDLTVNGDMQVSAAVTLSGNGTLTGANILAPTTPDAIVVQSGTFTLDGVTLSMDVTLQNGTSLNVENDLTLNSTVTLASIGSGTELQFIGLGGTSSTLAGSGEVVFGGTVTNDIRNAVRVMGSTHGLVIGSGITIRSDTSGGRLYTQFSNQPVTLQGTVVSDLDGRTVGLSGYPLTVTGATLQAIGGGSLSITAATGSLIDTPIPVSGGGGLTITGDWSNVPGNTLSVSGGGKLSLNGTWSNAAGATISQNGGELELLGDWSNAGQITVTDGLLDIGSSAFDEWTNGGVIDVINSTVELGGGFSVTDVGTLNTSGDVLLNGQLDNTGMTIDLGTALPGNVILASGGEVVGGTISGTALSLQSGTFTLDGVILSADVTLQNASNLSVENGLTLNSTVTLASIGSGTELQFIGLGGTSSTLAGSGEVVFGGTVTNDIRNAIQVRGSTHGLVIGSGITIRSDTSGGRVYTQFSNQPVTLQGTVVSDLDGRTVGLSGYPLTVTGATLQAIGGGSLSITAATGSLIDTPIPVSGGGGLTITGDWSNVPGNTLSVSGGGKLSLNGTWSNAAGATISQNGGELELLGDWSNAGQITVTDGLLDIGSSAFDEWTNGGVIDVINSTVELGGGFSVTDVGTLNTSGDVLLNGQLDNTGMTIDLGTALPGNVILASGGEVVGGTISGTALSLQSGTFTLDGVILSADVTLQNASNLSVENGLTLNSTVTLASIGSGTELQFIGLGGTSSTLAGSGEVVFGGTVTNDIRNAIQVRGSTHGLVIGSGITIRSDTSGGRVYTQFSNQPVTLQGTVVSDLDGRTVGLSGYPLTVTGATLQAIGGGSLSITAATGSLIDTPIPVSGGGGLTITGDWSNVPGNTLSVSGGGKLSLNGTWSNAAGATISQNGGELELLGDWSNAGQITVTDGLLDIGSSAFDEWTNGGVIDVINSTVELGGGFSVTDVGTLNTSGDVLLNGQLDNTGMTIDLGTALPGNVILASGGEVVGGTISGTALSLQSGTFTLDGVILSADVTLQNASNLSVENGLTLNSTVTLASIGSGTELQFIGLGGTSSTLDGSGEVVFGGTVTNDIRNAIQVRGSTHGLVIGSGITIRSDTSGGRVYTQFSNQPVTLQGTVVSDLAGRTVGLSGFPLTVTGTLQAGAGATVNVSTDYMLTGTASVDLEIGGLTTSDYGRITAASRAADLDGTLNLALVNGFSPLASDTFELMTFGTRNGIFATENGTDIGGGLSFQVNYNATDITLEVVN